MPHILTWENLAAFITLTALEITLGIDNIVFVAVLTGKLPERQREQARRLGLSGAMISRILLLLAITWIMRLAAPFFTLAGRAVSGRDIILLVGGLFLVAKATSEIHESLEGPEQRAGAGTGGAAFRAVILQIMILDIVFSLDSVITAVGMARELVIMIAAIVAAVGVMMFFAGSVSRFIERHPTMKMLAMAFLMLIGVVLVAESLGKPIPRGYIYFAMAFSFLVEMLNLKAGRGAKPVHLKGSSIGEAEQERP